MRDRLILGGIFLQFQYAIFFAESPKVFVSALVMFIFFVVFKAMEELG
jgi:hypothetical protein